MIVNCLKCKQTEESLIKDYELQITKEFFLDIECIPHFNVDEEQTIYYLTSGTDILICLKDLKAKIIYAYRIEQGIDKNDLVIKNIYSTTKVDDSNILAKFFRYDEENEKENITNRLINIINYDLKFITNRDKDLLKQKITEYLDKIEVETPKLEEPKFVSLANRIGSIETTNKELVVNGITYNSVASFCKENKIPGASYYDLVRKGFTPEEIIKKYKNGKLRFRGIKEKNFSCFDINFKSQNDFSKFFNIASSNVNRLIHEGYTAEEIIERYEKKRSFCF